MELENVVNLVITSYNQFNCLAHVPKGNQNNQPLFLKHIYRGPEPEGRL